MGLLAFTVVACGPQAAGAVGTDASASSTCASALSDHATGASGGTLVGAYVLTAEQLTRDDETRGGSSGPHPPRSEYRDYPIDTRITLCYFDGFIAAPGGPPPSASATWRPYDRYAITVDPSGKVRLVVAGHQDTLSVQPHLP